MPENQEPRAPERIWAYHGPVQSYLTFPGCSHSVEYIRADLHTAELAAVTARAEKAERRLAEQGEAVPAAWADPDLAALLDRFKAHSVHQSRIHPNDIPLYTHPPRLEAVKVKALDDNQIMEIIKEVAPWKDEPKLNDLLTYEKSVPLFPQATYDVPSYRAEKFVRAVERRILSALDTSPATGPVVTDAMVEAMKRIRDYANKPHADRYVIRNMAEAALSTAQERGE